MSLRPSRPDVRRGRADATPPASLVPRPRSGGRDGGPLKAGLATGQAGGLRSTSLGGVLVGALAIVLGSAALGILVNHFSPRGIPVLGKTDGVQLPLPAGVGGMTPEQARAAWEAKSAVFVDARVPAEYQVSHVPGALNLPPGEFEVRYPDLAEQVEAASTVIVYCEGMECGDSIFVAERLREVYQGAIFVVERGWPAWLEAGYPVTAGSQP